MFSEKYTVLFYTSVFIIYITFYPALLNLLSTETTLGYFSLKIK